MSGMAEILYIPETLRTKLGEDGVKELVDLLNQAAKNIKGSLEEKASDKLEQRLTETKGGIEKQIADLRTELKTEIAHTRADLIKWMFIFWVGQVAVIGGLLGLSIKLILTAIGR
ncbi:MAG: hypothetical protein IMW94_04385 [Thermoanaerobacter sp.]|nr:hypothetical protein [Thermoanaerobacter sp.]